MDTDRLARLLARLRPVLCAVLLAGLVVSVLLALRPQPEGLPVLVLRHRVVEGGALSRADVREVRVPEAAVPADALDTDAILPGTWQGAPLDEGTILTESNVDGSAGGRVLGAGEARLSLVVPLHQAAGLEAGDIVDIWSAPQVCDGSGCVASLLAQEVRLTSMVVDDDSSWGNSPTARVGLVLRVVDTGRVLGHTGAGTLSLVLRPPGGAPVTQHRGDSP